MTPFAINEGLITWEQTKTLSFVRGLLTWYRGEDTCHAVCSYLATHIPELEHVRGKFNGWDHSWLVLKDSRVIIDAYPWACGSGPLMVDTRTGSPWATLYWSEAHAGATP